MAATVKRHSAPSGNRDHDYFQPVCACGWEGSMYPNRTVEGRTLAERHAAEHRCKCYSDHNEDIRTKGSCDYCLGTETQ